MKNSVLNEKLFYGVPLLLLVRHGLEVLLRKDGYIIMLGLLQQMNHLVTED